MGPTLNVIPDELYLTNINKLKYNTKDEQKIIFDLKENIRKNNVLNSIKQRRKLKLKEAYDKYVKESPKKSISRAQSEKSIIRPLRIHESRSKIPKLEALLAATSIEDVQ
jgi:hypothetical protein